MRVPNLVTHGAVFLGVRDNGQERMAGTAFFMSVESHGYLVTARHCAEKAKEYGNLLVRINKRIGVPVHDVIGMARQAGEAELIEIEEPHWFFHEDLANDVAVMPMMPPQNAYAYIPSDYESWATADIIEKEAIGVGDDLIVVGLFASHHGRIRNLPIVRSGIIAAMPEEPIADTKGSGLSYDAYLAEVRSIGGLSGSPVWVVINPARVKPGSHERESRLHFYLLGLIRGHMRKDNDWLSDFDDEEERSLNTGIAMVTPIQKVLDIIELVERRRQG